MLKMSKNMFKKKYKYVRSKKGIEKVKRYYVKKKIEKKSKYVRKI